MIFGFVTAGYKKSMPHHEEINSLKRAAGWVALVYRALSTLIIWHTF
jgi:hypothetical protein